MLNFYMDCGFDSEEEFFEYLNQLRDKALLQDDSDDVVSSLAQDLSASFSEVTESIEGSSLYVEYVSPEPLNQVRDGKGYSVEATFVSLYIDFFYPFYIEEDKEVSGGSSSSYFAEYALENGLCDPVATPASAGVQSDSSRIKSSQFA